MSSVVVANWDLDGQASASMLIRSGFAEHVFFPDVGYYWLEDEWIDVLSNYEYIYVVDMHIPRRDVERLNTTSYVTILDDSSFHPNYEGLDVTCVCGERFSTTYVLMDYLGVEPDVDAILGMYNDVGDRILMSEYWDIFSKYLGNLGLNLDDLKTLANYFNAPYYYGYIDKLYRNVEYLMKRNFKRESLEDFDLHLKLFKNKDNYITKLLEDVVYKEGILYLEYKGELYVIHEVIKWLVEKYKDRNIVVVDKGYLPGKIQMAVYSNKVLINLLKKYMSMDLPVGGEKNFLGIIVDVGDFNRIYNEVIEYILNDGR